MEKPSFFSILTADVRYDPRLKKYADCKVLYSEITSLSNKNGYCHASNRYFAELYERPIPTISRWINILKECGYIKVVMIKEGKQIKERHIYPLSTPINARVNTPTHKRKEGINTAVKTPINTDVKENNTSLNNTSINTNSASHSNAQSVSQLEKEFEEVWSKYPNKKGKKQAFNYYKAWRKASVKHTNEYLLERLKVYMTDLQQNSWKHPMNGSTWFNGRFDDELEVDNPKPANKYEQEGYYDDYKDFVRDDGKGDNLLNGVSDDELPF